MGLKFGERIHSIYMKDTNGCNLSIDGLCLFILGIISNEEIAFGWQGWKMGGLFTVFEVFDTV